MLNVTVQPEPVQTAAGQQELIVSASQKFHWFGKLDTRASVAESQTDVARAHLAAAEIATIAKVKRAYYELYFIQQAISVTEAEQRLLGEIRDVANTRYKAGRTSQQDVLRAELEISNIENELIRLRQQLASGQARLARVLHVSPRTQLLALDHLSPEQVPRDLDLLLQEAVAARPELHAQLAAIRRDRAGGRLGSARLQTRRDSGVFLDRRGQRGYQSRVQRPRRISTNGRGQSARLPQAARVVRSFGGGQGRLHGARYDALRDGTLEEVADLFAQAQSQQDLLTLFTEAILPKARQTLEVSSQAYNVGEVDFMQLIDNWRQLLRYEVSYRRLEASLRQALAELERVVGGFTP